MAKSASKKSEVIAAPALIIPHQENPSLRQSTESAGDFLTRKGLGFETRVVPASYQYGESSHVIQGGGVVIGVNGDDTPFVIDDSSIVSTSGSEYKTPQVIPNLLAIAANAEPQGAFLRNAFLSRGTVHAVFERQNDEYVRAVGSAVNDFIHVTLGLARGEATRLSAGSKVLICLNGMQSKRSEFAFKVNSNTPNMTQKLSEMHNIASKLDAYRAYIIDTADRLRGVKIDYDFAELWAMQYGSARQQAFMDLYQSGAGADEGSLWGILQGHTNLVSNHIPSQSLTRRGSDSNAIIARALAGDSGVAGVKSTGGIIDTLLSMESDSGEIEAFKAQQISIRDKAKDTATKAGLVGFSAF